MFGNAKRGRCGGLDGQCDHVFVLGKRAKNAAKHPPPVEVVPKGDVTHGNRVAEAFEELKKQVVDWQH